ncbi:hypothetical protein V9K97_01820 [Variovorax sp. CCNWLW186]
MAEGAFATVAAQPMAMAFFDAASTALELLVLIAMLPSDAAVT